MEVPSPFVSEDLHCVFRKALDSSGLWGSSLSALVSAYAWVPAMMESQLTLRESRAQLDTQVAGQRGEMTSSRALAERLDFPLMFTFGISSTDACQIILTWEFPIVCFD